MDARDFDFWVKQAEATQHEEQMRIAHAVRAAMATEDGYQIFQRQKHQRVMVARGEITLEEIQRRDKEDAKLFRKKEG